MHTQVTLVTTPSHQSEATQAKDLMKQVGIDCREEFWPDVVAQRYEVPFIRDNRGVAYYGMEGIYVFVEQEKSASR